MLNSKPILKLSAAVFAVSMLPICHTDGQAPPAIVPKQDPKLMAKAKQDLAAYSAWIAAPWTDDDRPYIALREHIERSAQDGADLNKMMAAYKATWDAHLSDPKALFAYYYTAITATETDKSGGWDYGQRLMTFGAFSGPVVKFHPPHTYNYERLNFLCELEVEYDPDMKAIGLRLFHHNPHDFTVGYYLVGLLRNSRSPQDQAQALNLAKFLVHDHPRHWTAYALLAQVYYGDWKSTGKKADARAALGNFQQYLRLAPPEKVYRKQAEQYVKELEKV